MSNPSLPPRVPRRKAGEQFNPWRLCCGFYAPDIIARQRDLTDGPKRLYERLVRWAGQKGECWYSFDRIAAELGKCPRQVKSDMAVLERYGLVRHQRRGKRLANLYTFLWHPLFDSGEGQSPALHDPLPDRSSDVQPDAHHARGKEVQVPARDVQPSAPGEGQSAAREFCTESFVQRIGSSSGEHQPEAPTLTAEPVDDEPSSKKSTHTTVCECLTAFVRASGIEMPLGRMPVDEIADGLSRIEASINDLVGFLKNYAGHWRDAPATWHHVLVSFRRWTADPKTHRAICRRFALQEANERERRARIEHERTLNTPTDYSVAVALLGQVRIPWPLQARLERTGALISPRHLANQAREWQPCPKCHDTGSLGNAIDGDLAFCDCSTGEEVRYRHGTTWPEKEIARVHSDARSLIAAACYELGMAFTGDAVAEAEVRDDGAVIEIVPTIWHIQIDAITLSDVERALGRIRWKRRLEIKQYAGPKQDSFIKPATEDGDAPATPASKKRIVD